ncbi:hypothetical protein ACQCN2_14675 [Brevibacillus ginsengisoli]|uniref:hypothetical protein n=1 Tax=Brevibacillus ginsengisoli TaxID=363854 RepID=UPI003CF544F1
MEELQERIQRLREKIDAHREELIQLEEEWRSLQEQLRNRTRYLSSIEILDLIREKSGQEKNMTTIKRWADQGLLGEKIEEKEYFSLLVHKQGNKRFLFPKEAVYPFLAMKMLIRPRFEILDQIMVQHQMTSQEQLGVIISHQLVEDQFVYTVQLEQNREIISNIAEHLLRLVEEEP